MDGDFLRADSDAYPYVERTLTTVLTFLGGRPGKTVVGTLNNIPPTAVMVPGRLLWEL
jgi:hypothetical protein